ncbi:hypothetical protein GCM10020254_25720 [Streptomyces goshikiensis]
MNSETTGVKQVCSSPQYAVAVGVLADQDQQPAEVGAAQLPALAGDPVDGDEVPGAYEDFGVDAGLAQDDPDGLRDGGQRVALACVGGDQRAGVLVLLGVQDREHEVFQLGLERLDAEAFGERDEDVAGDLGDARLFVGAHDAEGAHVVEAVGELDGHDADVVAGGDEHLAEGLGLGGGAVVDLLDLGDAVDDEADLVAELLADLIEGHLGVLDRVVEQRGRQGRCLGAEFGQDQGHGERMCDVRLTTFFRIWPRWEDSASTYARLRMDRSASGWWARCASATCPMASGSRSRDVGPSRAARPSRRRSSLVRPRLRSSGRASERASGFVASALMGTSGGFDRRWRHGVRPQGRCLMLPTPPRGAVHLSLSVKRITH